MVLAAIRPLPAVSAPAPARTADSAVLGCPTPGTSLTARNIHGDYKLTAMRSVTKDPTICTTLMEGAGAEDNDGKAIRRIYGWYDVSHFIWPADIEAKARAALAAVLTGAEQQSRFDLTLRHIGIVQPWSGVVTWQREGTQEMSLGKFKLQTIHLKNTFQGGGNTKYNEVWDLWYAPQYHLWVKGEKRNTADGVVVGGFEVTSFSPAEDPAKTHGLLPPSLKRSGSERATIPQR
jgi:hypothetical protein